MKHESLNGGIINTLQEKNGKINKATYYLQEHWEWPTVLFWGSGLEVLKAADTMDKQKF